MKIHERINYREEAIPYQINAYLSECSGINDASAIESVYKLGLGSFRRIQDVNALGGWFSNIRFT